jgi:hypothetical protein
MSKCTCGGKTIHQKYCEKFIKIEKLDTFGFKDPSEDLKK